jgi:hypothetical protein
MFHRRFLITVAAALSAFCALPSDARAKKANTGSQVGISISLDGRNLGRARGLKRFSTMGLATAAGRNAARPLSERRYFSWAQRKITSDTKQTAAGTASEQGSLQRRQRPKAPPVRLRSLATF